MTDRIKQFIDASYTSGLTSTRRVVIELDKFLNIAVVTATIGRHTEIRHYLDGFEIDVAWLTPIERQRWIARMRAEGFKVRRMATFLNVCAGTIYKDLRFMRDERPNWLVNLVPYDRLTALSNIRVHRSRTTRVVLQ